MKEAGTRPIAVLDVGSNTVRLLVAQQTVTGLQALHDESRFVGLGTGVDASGLLDAGRQDAALDAIGELKLKAQAYHPQQTLAVATSAVRDASNGPEFVRRVEESGGLDLRILSGEEEARMTLLGATLAVTLPVEALVCDIGGGSSELIAVRLADVEWARSLQIGSGRMTDRFVRHDPPVPEEKDAIARSVRDLLRPLPALDVDTALFTGGTASHVALITGSKPSNATLDVSILAQAEESVYSEPSKRTARRFNIRLERARVLPAGITILRTIARWSGAGTVSITKHGLREGVILEASSREPGWRAAGARR